MIHINHIMVLSQPEAVARQVRHAVAQSAPVGRHWWPLSGRRRA